MNIFEFYRDMLGVEPQDANVAAWTDIAINTPCGRDCVKAILAAATLLTECHNEQRQTILEACSVCVDVYVVG